MSGLTDGQIGTLRDLSSIWPRGRHVLIGATAVSCFIDMGWRQTHDLDLAVSVSQEEYAKSLSGRRGWKMSKSREHSWRSPHDVMVDIIPAGVEELKSGRIVWPSTGAAMNLTGFRLGFERAVAVELTPGFYAEAAPLEVIALLKMVAYLDRPQERERDLEDLTHLFEEFVKPFAEERFSKEVLDVGMDYDLVSAYLLGARLAAIVNAGERDAVRAFVSRVLDEDDRDQTQARMVRAWRWHGGPESLLPRIAAFNRGFGIKD